MNRSQLLMLSLFCGVILTITLTWVAFSFENKNASRLLLWYAPIPAYLVGAAPSPELRTLDGEGEAAYEGPPIYLLAELTGLLLGVPIYSAVTYFLVRAITSSKFEGSA